MSDKAMWLDTMTFVRRDQTGLDATTRLPKFDEDKVLEGEPCDLSVFKRRKAVEGPNGTTYMMVLVHQLKIHPEDPTNVPDEDDLVVVNGTNYKVEEVETFFDGGSGEYRGSRLFLSAPETT
jgi:hypothetical protein